MASELTIGMARLLDRWMEDDAFRDAFAANPEEAIRAGGIDLTADDLAALHSVEWNLSDGGLAGRFNKPRARF